MINRIKYLLVISFLFSQNYFAQSTDKIEVSGYKVFSSSEILRWSGLRKGLQFNPSLIDTALSRISLNLAQYGYHHPTFDGTTFQITEDSSSVNIFVHINEGGPTYINEIYFVESDSVTEPDLISSLNFLRGQIFSKDDIEFQINNILTEYENTGFPFSNVIIRSVN
ncbi:MAG: hypothetical protein MUO34_13385, partial [Ignavibacteriaceae bacterium]|nr:hypothetical protein [Ignavibacteriaceae bacterium]